MRPETFAKAEELFGARGAVAEAIGDDHVDEGVEIICVLLFIELLDACLE